MKAVRIADEVHKELKILAAKEGVSLSDAIKKLLEFYESKK